MMPKKPSKLLIGRCIKVLKCEANKNAVGDEGVVKGVDDELITVDLSEGRNVSMNWSNGDRWTVIPNI